LEKAVTLDPRNLELLGGLDYNYWFCRRYEDQRRIVDRQLEIDPDLLWIKAGTIVQRVPVKILFDAESIKAVRDKIVPGLSTVPSIAVTQPLIDKPYPEAPENEKPSHQLANEPITQIRGVSATGVMQ
jgi:hypothetical protein